MKSKWNGRKRRAVLSGISHSHKKQSSKNSRLVSSRSHVAVAKLSSPAERDPGGGWTVRTTDRFEAPARASRETEEDKTCDGATDVISVCIIKQKSRRETGKGRHRPTTQGQKVLSTGLQKNALTSRSSQFHWSIVGDSEQWLINKQFKRHGIGPESMSAQQKLGNVRRAV